MNIRFWELFNNSWVKLTLAPGQVIRWYKYKVTDEGYHSEVREYEYLDTDTITLKIVDDCRDCDGRFTRIWEGFFNPKQDKENRLIGLDTEGNKIYASDIKCPVWHETKSSQRDYAAESVGY